MKAREKNSRRRWAMALALSAVAWLAAAGMFASAAPGQAALPSASAVASPRAYVSTEPVPRGRAFEIAVVVRLLAGFHINAHKVSESYLIPTALMATLPAGVKEQGISYPEGKLKKLAFSDTPLAVYTGEVTLRMRLAAAANAPLGKITLPLTLRYQACNDTTCLPPVKLPVPVKIEIAAAGTKTRAIHPAIFSGHKGPK